MYIYIHVQGQVERTMCVLEGPSVSHTASRTLHIYIHMHICVYACVCVHIYIHVQGWVERKIQIPARCPLFSSLKRTRDHVHTHTVAGAPSRLTRALRDPHTTAQKCPLPRLPLTPGCRWYALRSLSSVSFSAALCRRMAAGEQYATARPPARGKRVERGEASSLAVRLRGSTLPK